MYLIRITIIAGAAFMTIAGAPGPDDADETIRYGEQHQDLTDGKIPEEAENIQRLDEAASSNDTDATKRRQPEIAARDEPVEGDASVSASAEGDGTEIELALSDDYIQGKYFTGGGLLGLQRADGHIGLYFNDDRDLIGTLGLMTTPISLFIDRLSLSVGGRGYLALLAAPDNDDVFGVAPGVEARYALPVPYPVTAVGSFFYAPDILTLGDAENIVDLDARGEAQITSGLVGFIGYRVLRFDSDEGDAERAANEIQIGAAF